MTTVTISFPFPDLGRFWVAAGEWVRKVRYSLGKLAVSYLSNFSQTKDIIMVSEIVAALQKSLELAKALPKCRESAIMITKVEEAILWYGQFQISYVAPKAQ